MHLYGAAIASITWADVERFCQQGTAENTYLDYKRDFPSDLAKTIAAMANTLGGIILIGVDETNDGKPQLPLIGIDHDRGLDERVLNTILDTMTPPIIPDLVTCPNANGDKAVIVIRIPQSQTSPHVLHRNTSVYIRTGKRNKPEELADLNRVEWMRNGRQKAIDFREALFDRACVRFRNLRDGKVGGVPKTDEGVWRDGQEQPGLLTLALCPVYPDKALVTPTGLRKLRHDIAVKDYMGTTHEFPIQDSGCHTRMVEDGYVMHFSGLQGIRTYHTFLNTHGLYLFRQSLLWVNEKTSQSLIRGYEVMCRSYELMESAAKFYRKIGYEGPLKFRLRLEGLLTIPFWAPYLESGRVQHRECFSTDHAVDADNDVRASDLSASPHETLLPLYERVAWAFDEQVTLAWMRSMYDYMIRH